MIPLYASNYNVLGIQLEFLRIRLKSLIKLSITLIETRMVLWNITSLRFVCVP